MIDGEVILVSIIAGSVLIGLLVGRWWTLLVPIAAVPCFYLGLNAGWWGSGVGDGWQFAMIFVLGLTAVAQATAVGVRVAFGGRRRPRETRGGSIPP